MCSFCKAATNAFTRGSLRQFRDVVEDETESTVSSSENEEDEESSTKRRAEQEGYRIPPLFLLLSLREV